MYNNVIIERSSQNQGRKTPSFRKSAEEGARVVPSMFLSESSIFEVVPTCFQELHMSMRFITHHIAVVPLKVIMEKEPDPTGINTINAVGAVRSRLPRNMQAPSKTSSFSQTKISEALGRYHTTNRHH